jgi:glycosyltransferase involved in cell wall biosynthesis
MSESKATGKVVAKANSRAGALKIARTSVPAPLKSVSYIMPVLNEEAHLAAAVASIFEQEQTGPTEVIIALGPSTDGTDKVAAELVKKYPVVLVDNPSGKTPDGLNAAIKAAKYDVVVRVDAHSELSAGYTKLAVEILN